MVAAGIVAGIMLLTRPSPAPDLRFDASVPDDLRELAAETWRDFLAAHPARWSCIAPATLSAAWDLDSRGEYRPDPRTLVIRVPGTASTLRNELVHEFAHHVEFTCPDQADLRASFLDAQGLPPDATWFESRTWETTPSEQYAEATVEVVLGRRAHHGNIHLSDQALDVVRRWGAGS
ncbi:MAG: hypothetical protein ACXW10_05185 [Acidimicrobiia bacterium]